MIIIAEQSLPAVRKKPRPLVMRKKAERNEDLSEFNLRGLS